MNATAPVSREHQIDTMVIRSIQRRLTDGQMAPTLPDLQRMTGCNPIEIQASVRRLKKAGKLWTQSNGGYTIAGQVGAPVPWTQLTPEELERVRRGEPSTGRPIACASLPQAAVVKPGTPPAPVGTTTPKKTRRRNKRRVTDDQVRAVWFSHSRRIDAADALGITVGRLQQIAKELGLPRRPSRRPRISDAKFRRVVAESPTRRAAAALLGISEGRVSDRAKRLGLAPPRRGRPPRKPVGGGSQ